MSDPKPRLAGVELYFDDLERAKRFYRDSLGLGLQEDDPSHHAKFDVTRGFLCLERKGSEHYPSADKAVVFLEVPDLRAALRRVDPEHLVRTELAGARSWAAVRDTEGHIVLLLQAESGRRPRAAARGAAK